MYKVLLADDEPMALEGLKYVIDWERMGFSICGTCGNGKEAAEAINTYEPDVVITDIKMPVMDGLDLIRYTLEQGKQNIKFIVVSGYGEFEYAKKAMQYGVRYYLQKPIISEEIYEIITEIKEQLDQIIKERRNAEMDKKAVMDSVMGQLLRGCDSPEALEYLKPLLDEDTLRLGWNCIVVEIEASQQPDNDDEFKLARLAAENVINKVTESIPGFFVLEPSSNMFIILASLKGDDPHKCKMNDMAGRIYRSLVSDVPQGFTIGVGDNVMGIKSVRQSYAAAVEALGHRFYRGLNSLIFYNEIEKEKFNFEFNEIFMSSKVLESVEELDSNKIKNIIDTTFEYFRIHRIEPDIVKMFTSNMICRINNLIYRSDDAGKVFMDNHTVRELKDHERTIEELKEFFQGFCLGWCEHFKKFRSRNTGSNITKVEEFIKENFKRNITIRELAENVFMHPAYLGQLFIQKFGMGINEYIHEMRIEEAKRLMNETNMKNHEIAQNLGYCSYNSFLQQFQKYTGKKPTEFRSSVQLPVLDSKK